MGKRSLLSITTINRLISSSNRKAREKERTALIKNQSNNIKELPVETSVKDVDFNPQTRYTKIEFKQTQQYRTITRYVTQNYVKHPVYSDWKTKVKYFKKSIKLTNEELENLENNYDDDIRQFASEIILKINNPDLLPSWFLKKVNLEAYREDIELLNNEYIEYKKDCEFRIKGKEKIIEMNKDYLPPKQRKLKRLIRKKNKYDKKVKKISNSNKNPAKYVFSFFIYSYLVSAYRKKKIIFKIDKILVKINALSDAVNKRLREIENCELEIKELKESISTRKNDVDVRTKQRYNELSAQQRQVTALPKTIRYSESFLSLQSLVGVSHSLIIGCYIIHNTLNDKYYVGQSKDVIKRLRQHFKGTVPNNIIFAEDYYTAPLDKRDKLFEVKIIPCLTKDELDRTEKSLIEEYSAFETGYNGTSGNK